MSYFQQEQFTKAPKREKKDYFNSSRLESVNHLKTEITKKPGHSISDFFTKTLWSWIYHYFKSRFGRKYPYPNYAYPNTGIYQLDRESPVTICIASDWATDTEDSFVIAARMKEQDPDYTIHVGDTYYVGAPPEIISNFTESGSPWVRGSKGSFALLGNHEMYARGDAFFETLLPSLGISGADGGYKGQKAGFFCLENDHWRILGLDTGYHSTGMPLLEFLPWFAPDCSLPDTVVDWLKNVVKLGDEQDKRGLVILTHHQYATAFDKESEYLVPARQLAEIIGEERKVLWFWGHEHKLALYSLLKIKNGISAYGRCIGNGGTPVEIDGKTFRRSASKNGYSKLVFVDQREQKKYEGTRLGYNSFVKLVLKDEELVIRYHDNERSLFEENWKADLATGEIHGALKLPPLFSFQSLNGKSWEELVGKPISNDQVEDNC